MAASRHEKNVIRYPFRKTSPGIKATLAEQARKAGLKATE
jgi:hypothetical protein